MKKSIVAMLALLPVLAFAGGGTYSVPVGTNMPIVTPFVSAQDMQYHVPTTNGFLKAGITPWASNTTYAVGAVALLKQFPYFVQTAGTSGATSPNPGADTISDNGVVWLAASAGYPKKAVIVQLVSGACTLHIDQAPLSMNVAGTVISLGQPSCFDGMITANAVTTNTTVNVVTY